jgi:2-keto-4-pentenoate hydratase/2-oxohepta-3-ene-1,7-dioic acid hydratase in catechol pathway
MRIARLDREHGPELALVTADGKHVQPTGIRAPLATLLHPEGFTELTRAAAAPEPLISAELLPPITPRLIVGVGLNYRAHAAEQGRPLPEEPLLFLKNPRSLAPPFGTVPLHPASTSLDYEAELGIVIGRALFACTAPEAETAIAGWLVAQDYTLRDLARAETLAIAKGGPGMAPVGPWLTTVETMAVADAGRLDIRCTVNGELRQSSSTSDMHFGAIALVQYIARFLPLGPGDIILTGSPGGSGVSQVPARWLKAGDRVETDIQGLGCLHQEVVTRK